MQEIVSHPSRFTAFFFKAFEGPEHPIKIAVILPKGITFGNTGNTKDGRAAIFLK